MLGPDCTFNEPTVVDDAELTGFPVYDALTKVM